MVSGPLMDNTNLQPYLRPSYLRCVLIKAYRVRRFTVFVAMLSLLYAGLVQELRAEQPDDFQALDSTKAPGAAEYRTADEGVPVNENREEDHSNDDQGEGSAELDDKGFEFAILPGPFVTKETGLGVAVSVNFSFYPSGRSEGSWPSSVGSSVAYTMNDQLMFKVLPRIYWDKNRWVIDSVYDVRLYPNRYYGIGNDTPDRYQLYTETAGDFRTEVRRAVHGKLYVAAIHHLRAMFDFEEDGVFDARDDEIHGADSFLDGVRGAETGLVHGLGLGLVYDCRDDPVHPLRGGFYSTSIVGYPGFLGSDYEYGSWLVDLRQYVPVIPDREQLLAFQFLHEARFGNPPFHQLGELGGPWQMRGFFKGRYRDDHMAMLQAEYRFHIWWRLHGVAFLSLGEVYGETDFSFSELQHAGGIGIRFRFGENIYIRLDFGFGPDTNAVIFNAGHAF